MSLAGSATSNYWKLPLTSSIAGLGGSGMSLAFWVKGIPPGGSYGICQFGNDAAGSYETGAVTYQGNLYLAFCDGPDSTSSGPPSGLAAWTHIILTMTLNGSFASYYNGTYYVVNSISTFNVNNQFKSLNLHYDTRNQSISAQSALLADVSVWNAPISAGEALALARGASPMRIARQALQYHFPLRGSLVDSVRGVSLVPVGNAPLVFGENPPSEQVPLRRQNLRYGFSASQLATALRRPFLQITA